MEIELNKGTDGNVKNVITPQYDPKEKMFRMLIESVALSTTSFFAYQPNNDEVRAYVAKERQIDVAKIPKDVK